MTSIEIEMMRQLCAESQRESQQRFEQEVKRAARHDSKRGDALFAARWRLLTALHLAGC